MPDFAHMTMALRGLTGKSASCIWLGLFVCLFLFWAIPIIHNYIYIVIIAPLVNGTLKGIMHVRPGHWVGFVYVNNDFAGEVNYVPVL